MPSCCRYSSGPPGRSRWISARSRVAAIPTSLSKSRTAFRTRTRRHHGRSSHGSASTARASRAAGRVRTISSRSGRNAPRPKRRLPSFEGRYAPSPRSFPTYRATFSSRTITTIRALGEFSSPSQLARDVAHVKPHDLVRGPVDGAGDSVRGRTSHGRDGPGSSHGPMWIRATTLRADRLVRRSLICRVERCDHDVLAVDRALRRGLVVDVSAADGCSVCPLQPDATIAAIAHAKNGRRTVFLPACRRVACRNTSLRARRRGCLLAELVLHHGGA